MAREKEQYQDRNSRNVARCSDQRWRRIHRCCRWQTMPWQALANKVDKDLGGLSLLRRHQLPTPEPIWSEGWHGVSCEFQTAWDSQIIIMVEGVVLQGFYEDVIRLFDHWGWDCFALDQLPKRCRLPWALRRGLVSHVKACRLWLHTFSM